MHLPRVGVIFPEQKKSVCVVKSLVLLKKIRDGWEIWGNIRRRAQKRLVDKMIPHYRVGRNVWFYFIKMTKMGAFAILHIYYRRNSFAGNGKAWEQNPCECIIYAGRRRKWKVETVF